MGYLSVASFGAGCRLAVRGRGHGGCGSARFAQGIAARLRVAAVSAGIPLNLVQK